MMQQNPHPLRQIPHALYLHVPFCRAMCSYCAFNTYIDMDHLIDPYITALAREISILGMNSPGLKISSIYFGGGTPSLLGAEQYEQILENLCHHFSVSADAEICLESNPDDLSHDYLMNLHLSGFNRLSIGLQTANKRELRLYNRKHDNSTVIRAVEFARKAGFQDISFDLIYGAPQETLSDWEKTLKFAISLNPEHISAYGLQLEGGTPLKRMVDDGEIPLPDDDTAADMYELATALLEQAGFEQYEISNWSKPGFQSRHNLQYWRNLPYLGLGPGAHGYAGNLRYSIIRLPQRYIKALQTGQTQYDFPSTPATARAVRVSRKDEIAETIMMGLRLVKEGIQRQAFQERFGADLVELKMQTIDKLVEYGVLYVDNQVVRLTERGRLVSNSVIRALI